MSDGNAEGRQRALQRYRILAIGMGLAAGGLLTCGIIAVTKYPEGGFGPPYYIGGFTGGILGLLHALLCVAIIVKASDFGTDEIRKRELQCAMTGQQVLSMFLIMGCFVGVMMAGMGGFNKGLFDDEINPNSQKLAGAIIGLCILVLFINIFGMCILCTYGSFFGVYMNRNRGVLVTQNAQGTTIIHMPDNTTQGGTFQANSQVTSLQEQNRLLQQQIQLQQQLINQQMQQQPGQYGFQPPPPANYPMGDAAYPPSAPPSYDKVA